MNVFPQISPLNIKKKIIVTSYPKCYHLHKIQFLYFKHVQLSYSVWLFISWFRVQLGLYGWLKESFIVFSNNTQLINWKYFSFLFRSFRCKINFFQNMFGFSYRQIVLCYVQENRLLWNLTYTMTVILMINEKSASARINALIPDL